jgi:hypothetical protein
MVSLVKQTPTGNWFSNNAARAHDQLLGRLSTGVWKVGFERFHSARCALKSLSGGNSPPASECLRLVLRSAIVVERAHGKECWFSGLPIGKKHAETLTVS